MSEPLAKREQQIIEVLHERTKATAQEVLEGLSDPPSYSAVRALLAVMERKGLVKHQQEGQRYVYSASVTKEKASRRALSHLIQVFFGGSREQAVAALLDGDKLDKAELDRIAALIKKAKEQV